MGCDSSLNADTNDNNKEELNNIISSASKSITKIEVLGKITYGFFVKFFKDDKDFFCLMTNNENITDDMVKRNEAIKLFYDNESKTKKIELNSKERYIKDFSDIGINSIIIELLPSDEIDKDYFVLPIINEYENLKNEDIIAIHFPKGIMNYSKGKIKEINKYEFTHSAQTEVNSQGNPIFLKSSIKVLGIQKNSNLDSKNYYADFIKPIFDFFSNYSKNAEKTININESTYKNSKKEGGKIIYEDGQYYIGEEKNGKRNGKGILYSKDGIILYEGDWLEDQKNGKGKFFMKNTGAYLLGEFKNGKAEGKGKIINKDGIVVLEGYFINNKFNGKGIQHYDNGKLKYEGDFVNFLYEGEGKFYEDGILSYKGQFKKGFPNGKGIKYFPDGDVHYEGDFIDGKLEGNGKLIYKNRSYYYIGQFKNNLRHGKGNEYKMNGDLVYEGDWVEDLAEGKGKYYFDDGSYYIGQFIKEKKHGKGIDYDKDGNILYEGDFVENIREGQGKTYNKDGSYEVGQWKNDLQEGNFQRYDKNGKDIGIHTYEHGKAIGGMDEMIFVEN